MTRELDKQDTLWEFDPHTLAKHKILKRYIEAWAAILTQGGHNGRVVYIDGFAGPGEDITKQKPGSPIIGIDAILNHSRLDKFKAEIVMFFTEERKDRTDHLENLLKTKYPTLPKNIKYEVKNDEFNSTLAGILNSLEKDRERLAPTFCFVDPFGWNALHLDMLARFMLQNKAELLITFMAGFIQRFLSDGIHSPSLRYCNYIT